METIPVRQFSTVFGEIPMDQSGDVRFFPSERRESEFLAFRLFRRKLNPSDYLRLIGAPGHLHVQVGTLGASLYLEFSEYDHVGLTGSCLVGIKRKKLCLVNEGCRLLSLNACQRGIGRQWFYRQKTTCEEFGIKKINTLAVRSAFSHGFFILPRFGFDAKIPFFLRERLSPPLRDCFTLADLFRASRGKNWWRIHGVSLDVSFDLTPGSVSQKVWNAYFAEYSRRNSQGKK